MRRDTVGPSWALCGFSCSDEVPLANALMPLSTAAVLSQGWGHFGPQGAVGNVWRLFGLSSLEGGLPGISWPGMLLSTLQGPGQPRTASNNLPPHVDSPTLRDPAPDDPVPSSVERPPLPIDPTMLLP